MNKKGAAALEVIVSITLLAILVIISTNAQTYLATHEKDIDKVETFTRHMETELTSIYYDDLVYDEKTIETDMGDLKVQMEYNGVDSYGVDVHEVTFTAEVEHVDDFDKSFLVERSRYYVE